MAENIPAAAMEKEVETRSAIFSFVRVAKPAIVGLVLVATLSGMYMAGKVLPDYSLIFWTLLGIGLATAGAASLNNYIDRDIDQIMKRTRGRVLPAGSLAPARVLYYGIALSTVSVTVGFVFVNWLTGALLAAAIIFYVVLYTLLSKRRTPMATFIGGIGGALPPVIGYTAVRPELDIYALALFLIIFTWQHPHFWSLSLKYIDEYKAAGVRNHPVVMGVEATKRRIALWAVIMAPATTLPWFLGMAGEIYLATALIVSAVHILMSLRFMLSTRKVAMSLFVYSIIQLPVLYTVMLIDII